MKSVCDICGWVYDESPGDSELDIDPGTKFEDLPDDFEYPECYASKDAFTDADE